jgi:hypothetical protein
MRAPISSRSAGSAMRNSSQTRKLAIEIAGIDAFQLDVQYPTLDGARSGGIAGHAVNH